MFSASKTGAGASGYPIVNSLRFQSASSQYLSRTPSTTTNRKTWTQSFWIKTSPGTDRSLIGIVQNSSQTQYRVFFENSSLRIFSFESGFQFQFITTQVFRDPGAWYHIVIVLDTTQATSTNRFKLYVNGTQVTAFSTASYPSLNADCNWNRNLLSQIGASGNTDAFFDGYLTEMYCIDGQALTPSSFGETDATTGQWIAKSYSGSYGTNGFYLKFTNGTSTTTLGADSSGNGNNWTLNNFIRSAGVSDCWMKDVPSGNGGASGTQPASNYAVMNPLNNNVLSAWNIAAFKGANLDVGDAATNQNKVAVGTMAMSSGKYYWEVTIGTGFPSASTFLGVTVENQMSISKSVGIYYRNNGEKQINGTNSSYGASYTAGDVIGFAYDGSTGTLTCYKNNVSQGAISSSLSGNNWNPTMTADNPGSGVTYYNSFNFGQRSFAYTPPTGFKALCTANLPAATIKQGNQYMDATTYTGNGTTNRAVVNSGAMQPDFVWVKSRSNTANHILVDAVRGLTSVLYSNTTLVQQTGTAIASLNSNGFSVNEPNTGADSSNISGQTYVGWQWNAGGTTVTNTSGSISSQVRANPTAGVSVVTYTGTGANATVGHGLGVAPSMVIVKNRSSSIGWMVRHISIPATQNIELQATAAAYTSAVWNNTAPTSSVFSIGTGLSINNNGQTYVAYCFSEIAGFSKFGSYTGNGSTDGTFVYTGFRPKFVMIKRTDAGGSWFMIDTSRAPYNVVNPYLMANVSNAEATDLSWDILSNGFKLRSAYADINASSGTFIYMAFAENPFAQANAR